MEVIEEMLAGGEFRGDRVSVEIIECVLEAEDLGDDPCVSEILRGDRLEGVDAKLTGGESGGRGMQRCEASRGTMRQEEHARVSSVRRHVEDTGAGDVQ